MTTPPQLPQNIFELLTNLAANNNREWYQEHKPAFQAMEEGFKAFAHHLLARLETFDTIQRPKLYRLYRDVRFSKDKTPFHTYRGFSFFIAGRGEYYLHIQPQQSFVMVGYWAITPEDLKRLREEFDQDVDSIQGILAKPGFKKHFQQLEPYEVKTAPRGYDKTHDNIAFIRKKSLIVKKEFTDEAVLSTGFFDEVLSAYQAGNPLLSYINDVLSTDINGVPLDQ